MPKSDTNNNIHYSMINIQLIIFTDINGIRIYFEKQMISIGLYLKLTNLEPDIYLCNVAVKGVAYDSNVGKIGSYKYVDNFHSLSSFIGWSMYHDTTCLQKDNINIEFKTIPYIESTTHLSSDMRIFQLSHLERFKILTVSIQYDNITGELSPCRVNDDRLVRIYSGDIECTPYSIGWHRNGVDVTFKCSNDSSSLININITVYIEDRDFKINYISIGREAIRTFAFEPYSCYQRVLENIVNMNVISTSYNVTVTYNSNPVYDLYSILIDGYVGTCLKLKNDANVKLPLIIEFRSSDWRRVKSLRVIVVDAAYVSDIELNISLLAVNGSYESDSLTTRWINVLNSCLESLVYDKIINITGYLIYEFK